MVGFCFRICANVRDRVAAAAAAATATAVDTAAVSAAALLPLPLLPLLLLLPLLIFLCCLFVSMILRYRPEPAVCAPEKTVYAILIFAGSLRSHDVIQILNSYTKIYKQNVNLNKSLKFIQNLSKFSI